MAKADRNGKRKPREAFRTKAPDLGHYFILTDTAETEKNYLQGLQSSLPAEFQGRIVISVSKAKTQELVEKCKEKAALEPQYAQRWIVFDRDRVADFDEIIERAKQEGIHVGWSNPCIEVWFDAYFGKMHTYNNSVTCCRKFGETFKRKTRQEYQKTDQSIYALLNRFGDETKAIQIAEKRLQEHLKGGTKKPSEMCPCTTIHQLVDEIRKKTGKTNISK